MSKELKPLLSALIGFGTVMALQQTNVGTQLTQRTQQSESIMIFAALLIVQFLFEVLSKYEGKACEMTEGIFAGIMGVVGYSLVKMATQRGTGGLGGLGRMQFGGAVQNGILSAAGVAVGLWVWKRWLKPLILPTECSPCAKLECPPCPPPQVVVQQQQSPEQQMPPQGVEQFYY
jgi:hypothetical protein